MLRTWIEKKLFPTCDIPVNLDRENLWHVIDKQEKHILFLEQQVNIVQKQIRDME